jgi:hypothetical protein
MFTRLGPSTAGSGTDLIAFAVGAGSGHPDDHAAAGHAGRAAPTTPVHEPPQQAARTEGGPSR